MLFRCKERYGEPFPFKITAFFALPVKEKSLFAIFSRNSRIHKGFVIGAQSKAIPQHSSVACSY